VSVEIADHVEANWADEYPYIIRFTVEDDPAYASQLTLLVTDVAQYSGRLLLSRYPINDQEIVASSVGTTEEQEVTIYNVHLPPPLPDNSLFSTATRSQNLVTLLESVTSDPVILIGDFNMSDQSNDYHSVTSQYTDVFRATQSGFGNNLSPLLGFVPSIIRIDYIFVSNSITPQSSQVLYEGVSDHYPVYAEVVIE
ncbi:MAG: endonuclease/exonuclease/phosphatase family protein, partial [Chloroflexota bacterium]